MDLARVDHNLQALRAIEQSWKNPLIPDEIKLDLAGNALMTPAALGILFNGLAADLEEQEKPTALPTRTDFGVGQPVNPSYGYQPKSTVGRTVAGVAGLPEPQVYDVAAPQKLKQRLADEGYLNLTPEEIANPRWLPEYSYAAREMNFNDMSSAFQGNKPGSLSVDSILGFVDEWLSPRGLYRAAVELDLWWDTGQISKEYQEWDEKLAAWREDPFNVRKLVDLTGPVDDLLFPALNLALMFIGVGEIIAVGRGLTAGVKGAQAMAGLYRGGRGMAFMRQYGIGSGFSGVDDIARFSQPSFLSRKAAGIGMDRTAHLMNQWRSKGAVILAKKANQQVMRAGFTSNLEQLIDSDRGGRSLDRFTGVGEQINLVFSNPAVDWGVDLLLTPTNIWNPGKFSSAGKGLVETAQRGFLKAANNENLISAYNRPVRQYLLETGGEKAAKNWDDLVSKRGLKGALLEQFFEHDEEAMGAALGFTTTMAAIDYSARRAADAMTGGALHGLDSKTRTLYHQARNTNVARLRQLDPNNVEDLLTHIAKYGDLGDTMQNGVRRADRFQANYRKVRERYLEPIEATRARNGAIPDGHVRFVGEFNTDLGRYEWRPARGFAPEGDPFFVDIHQQELLDSFDNADEILSGSSALPDEFANRYLRHDASGALRHNRLSEASRVRLFDPNKLAELKGLAARHNHLRNQYMVEMMNELSDEALEQYLYEVLPTFGRWNDFVEASGKVREFQLRGELANATFVSPMSESNRALAAIPRSPGQDKWTDELFKMMLELPDDEQLTGSLMKSIFAPFARNVDPQMGHFTVAASDTVTKQQALAFAATAKRATRMVKALRRIKALPRSQEIIRTAQQLSDEVDVVRKGGLREALAEVLGAKAVSEDRISDLAAIARIADEAGVSLDEVENVLLRKVQEIDAMPDWAEKYMVVSQMDRVDDIVKAVDDKIRELQQQAFFMASEVENVPDTLIRDLAEKNYKLVYGVEFAQPLDVDDILPQFAEISRRQLRQKSLGSFFSRQDPEAVVGLKVRKVRDALHARLSKVDDGLRLNLGDVPDPSNADLNKVVDDLWEILREVQDDARHNLDKLQGARILEKVATRASLARIPYSLDRLGSDMGYKKFILTVTGRGYSENQAKAMFQALQSAQALGFRHHGLFAIESKLRSENNLAESLRLFAAIDDPSKLRRAGRGVAGGVGGAYAANYAATEAGAEPGSDEQLLAAAGGFLAGGALGASRLGIPGVRRLADAVESKTLRWGYVADHVANIRDLVRFSLSPVFDASRYSEAIILSQVGELPPGLQNLRVNQSPTAWRRQKARALRAAGMDTHSAQRMAQGEWEKNLDMFAAAARDYKDFDWEVIDGIGRRFSSVGILGFSPTDWMASTFGHLVDGGVDARKAYETVREIYTYGTTGRSAAELSMNFVFFPFSFTKKTVGHLSKFFSDDLTRLIVLHDMAATYQALDERYDLSQEWRDRMPILEKAHRLNLLAYGIGLGRFGGVNDPIAEATARLTGIEQLDPEQLVAPVVNAFIPQMVPMNSVEDADTAWETARQMLPVMNDVNTMISMMVEQGYVVGSDTHMTRQAEQRRAWDEWRQFQTKVEEELKAAGMTWNQAIRHPQLGPLLQSERTRISLKYPSWKQGMGDGIAHQAAIEMELRERIMSPTSTGDLHLARFHELIELTEGVVGVTFDGSPESIPPSLFDRARRAAIDFAREDPEFLRLYNRFYRRILGDITTDA